MRRAQAIVALIALLSAPLALFARGRAYADACTKSCCAAMHHSTQDQRTSGHCHGANRESSARCCDEPAQNHALDYGFTVLMPQSIIPVSAIIPAPGISRSAVSSASVAVPSGLSPAVFEPPRA